MSIEQHDTSMSTWELDQQPVITMIETDRFCDQCGYNLLGQVVRRDARTDLLLSRCPECGRVHAVRDAATVGRVWLQRVGTALLWGWIGLVIGWGLMCMLGQGLAIALPLDELTTYRRVAVSPATISPSGSGAGGMTYRYVPVPREEVRDYRLMMTLFLSFSAGLGFVLAMLLVVAVPHWRRWGYFAAAVLTMLVPAAFVWIIWTHDFPHLREWARPYVIGQSLAYLGGATIGVLIGRPLARGIVRLVLPPRPRQVLAYLWRVDGKPVPDLETADKGTIRTRP